MELKCRIKMGPFEFELTVPVVDHLQPAVTRMGEVAVGCFSYALGSRAQELREAVRGKAH